MNRDLEMKLQALPPLSRSGGDSGMVTCKVCGQAASFFDLVDFNKVAGETNCYAFGPSGIEVPYHRCHTCGFLFTKFFDDWQTEDFRRFLYNADYSMVDPEYAMQRPQRTAERIAGLLHGLENVSVLDYGSGSGVFSRCMAERGFENVQEYDPFSQPTRPTGQFDVIICNEVLEHSPDPLGTMRDMRSFLREEGCIVLGESLQPADIERLRANWWYCAPRNGHCSTFAERTLSLMAAKLNLLFHRGGTLIFRPIRARIGMEVAQRVKSVGPFLCHRLVVPRTMGSEDLHPVEVGHGRPFRWTARPRLTWMADVNSDEPVALQIVIPFVMEIEPGFAAKCHVTVGAQSAQVSLSESSIIAEATGVEPGNITVTLTTPDHKSPAKLRGTPDSRELGLALVADDA
jgi:Methyltransferase domain